MALTIMHQPLPPTTFHAQVVNGVRSGEVTEAKLAAKLQEHVEQIDVDMVGALSCLH